MAHEITIRANNKAEMAFVGEVPWHGLGQPVTPGASVGVWRQEAGLDWEAQEAAMLYRADCLPGTLQSYSGKKVLCRSDTGAPLGAVSSKFQVVQPSDVLEFFRDITESGGWHIHTAGSLRGGSKIWAMASQEVTGAVTRHDRVHGNLLLATSMDGSMKTTARLTSVRVVCANTLALSLREDGDSVTVSHRSFFDADEVKESLGVAVGAFDGFMLRARGMAETAIGTAEAKDVLRELFGRPTEREIKATDSEFEFRQLMAQFAAPGVVLREQRSVQRSLALFAGEGMGSQLDGSAGTRWGLLNAVTQHVDHEMGRTADTRLESAWFGRGDEIKRKALDLLAPAGAPA